MKQVDFIKAEEITISFVCKNYPHKMMEHLQKVHHLKVENKEKGLYYIHGYIFPMQLILTSKLSKKLNFWLRNLTNDLKEEEEAEDLVREYGKNQKSKLHQAVMDIIVRANGEIFREDEKMCEALMEILRDKMKDELDEREKEGAREKMKEQIRKKLSKGKSIEQIAAELEEEKEVIEELIKSLSDN